MSFLWPYKALSFFIDNEYVYRSTGGNIVYDRFMNLWQKPLLL